MFQTKVVGVKEGCPGNFDLDLGVKGQNHFKVNIVFSKSTLLTPEMESTEVFTFK